MTSPTPFTPSQKSIPENTLDVPFQEQPVSVQAPQNELEYYDDELNIFELFQTLFRYKFLIIIVTLGTLIIAFFYAKSLPKIYQSKVVLLPIVAKQSVGLSAALAQLGGAASLLGLSNRGSSSLTTIMESRSFHEYVVETMDLMPLLFPSEQETPLGLMARLKGWFGSKDKPEMTKQSDLRDSQDIPTIIDGALVLSGRIKIDSPIGKETIEVEVEWPQKPDIAAKIANGFANCLSSYLKNETTSKENENLKFIEGRLELVKIELEALEENLKNFNQRYKTLSPQEQIQVINQTLANLKTDQLAKSISIRVLPIGSTEANALKEQISALQEAIDNIEGSHKRIPENSSAFFPVTLSEFPTVVLEYTQLQRELTVKREVYTVLRSQIETAKIEEAQEKSSFKVLDTAIPSKYPSKPKKLMIFVFAGILSFIGSIFLVLLIEFFKREKARFKSKEVSALPKSHSSRE
ncbi:GNVR domain-containing protein [Deltaproteobacteria bacterium TL4]